MTAGQLDGEVALVAGAGRGIGRCVATWFAAAGAELVLISRTSSEVVQLAAELESDYGTRALARECDVTDAIAVEQLVADAVGQFGHVDVAVANAAVLGPVGAITGADPIRWMDTLGVNVGGTVNIVRSVLPSMTERGRGRIITLSGGGVGGPRLPDRLSAYVASKAAVVALTEVLAKELVPGVTINAVAPGAVPTTFMHEVLERGPAVAGEQLHDAVASMTMPDLEPLRQLLLFLLSEDAERLSGCCFSARWDDPATLRELGDGVMASSRFRLRRIDEDLFHEARTEGGA